MNNLMKVLIISVFALAAFVFSNASSAKAQYVAPVYNQCTLICTNGYCNYFPYNCQYYGTAIVPYYGGYMPYYGGAYRGYGFYGRGVYGSGWYGGRGWHGGYRGGYYGGHHGGWHGHHR